MPDKREGYHRKSKCPAVRNIFYNFREIPSNRFKVFYFHLELPSDQENKNDFAEERLWA